MTVIDKILTRYESELDETWLGDVLEVTWAHMERARKEREERAAEDSLARMNQRKGTVFRKPIV
jgi:hypothetical protein